MILRDDDHDNPELMPSNRKALERRVKYALKEGGIDIPSVDLLKEITEMVIAEKTELRTMMGEIIGTLADRGDEVKGEALERLAFIAEHAYRDATGEIQVSFGD